MDSIAKQAEEIRSSEEREVRENAKSLGIVACILIALAFGATRLVEWILFGHAVNRSDLYWGAGGLVVLWWGTRLQARWDEERRIRHQRMIRIELLLKRQLEKAEQQIEQAQDRHADLLLAVQSRSPDEKVYRTRPLPLPK